METAVATALQKLKIVIVEDDPTIHEFLKESIVGLGHAVVGEAATGTDMVRTVLALEPDVVVFDIDEPWVLDPDQLKSKCKNTPFDEARLQGRVLRTIVAGRTVFEYAAR